MDKANATLACGCRVHLTKFVRDDWAKDSRTSIECPYDKKVVRIVSLDGPESLAKLFRF